MGKNELKEDQPKEDKVQPLSELAQLRDIVFGEAQRLLQAQQKQMFQDLQSEIENLDISLNRSMDQGFKSLEQDISNLDKKTSSFDIDHHERSDILKSELDQLATDLSSQGDHTTNEMDTLHDKFTADLNALSTELQKQILELVSKLAQVSGDLDSSKTDRKQLAQLFNTVAFNLEKEDSK